MKYLELGCNVMDLVKIGVAMDCDTSRVEGVSGRERGGARYMRNSRVHMGGFFK